MANTCSDCLLYQGTREKCAAGYTYSSSASACSSFKGPASLFNGKKCGGCRLYKGTREKCGAGYTYSSSASACSSYAASPG